MKHVGVVAVISALLLFAGCSKDTSQSSLLGESAGAVAGVTWSVPARWTVAPQRPMRAATYVIPAAEGDASAGECGVFYFGTDQGGVVEDNINRWAGQFELTSGPEQSTSDVHGMSVTTVRMAGTYLNPSGPMMQAGEKREGYRLLGAIVAGPQGSVFFKATGPAATVLAAEQEFNAMIGSLSH